MKEPELLSNFDLIELYKMFNVKLNKVLSKDLFKYEKPKLGNYVINLDDSNGSGTHWTCLILTKTHSIYFDSFGFSLPNDILRFIHRYNKNCKIIYANSQIQAYRSVLCGYYCFYFHYFVTKLHRHNRNYKYLMNKYNSIFTKINRNINDKILHKIMNNLNLSIL